MYLALYKYDQVTLYGVRKKLKLKTEKSRIKVSRHKQRPIKEWRRNVSKVLLWGWWDWQGIIYWGVRLRPNSYYGPVLSTIRPSAGSNRSEAASFGHRRGIVSHQNKAKLHTSKPEAPGAWLGISYASTLWSRLGTKWLLTVLVHGEWFYWWKTSLKKSLRKSTVTAKNAKHAKYGLPDLEVVILV